MNSQHKIHSQESLLGIMKNWHLKTRSIVFTNGCFDILHPGHIACLEKAKSFGDHLIVGVNSDASVRRLKGPKRPILDEQTRTQLVAGLEAVDAVVLFSEDTPESLIRILKPSVLVKGGDYKLSNIAGADFVLEAGGKVEIVDLISGYSTSSIIEKIKGL